MGNRAPMAPRPIHYASHGTGGLAFECYFRDVRTARDGPRKLTRYMIGQGYTAASHPQLTTAALPYPRRHTDLRRVTCEECWSAIYRLAREQAGR